VSMDQRQLGGEEWRSAAQHSTVHTFGDVFGRAFGFPSSVHTNTRARARAHTHTYIHNYIHVVWWPCQYTAYEGYVPMDGGLRCICTFVLLLFCTLTICVDIYGPCGCNILFYSRFTMQMFCTHHR